MPATAQPQTPMETDRTCNKAQIQRDTAHQPPTSHGTNILIMQNSDSILL